MNADDSVKDCPYCGERIKVKAVLCRFCKTDLKPQPLCQKQPNLSPLLQGRADKTKVSGAIIFVSISVVFIGIALWGYSAMKSNRNTALVESRSEDLSKFKKILTLQDFESSSWSKRYRWNKLQLRHGVVYSPDEMEPMAAFVVDSKDEIKGACFLVKDETSSKAAKAEIGNLLADFIYGEGASDDPTVMAYRADLTKKFQLLVESAKPGDTPEVTEGQLRIGFLSRAGSITGVYFYSKDYLTTFPLAPIRTELEQIASQTTPNSASGSLQSSNGESTKNTPLDTNLAESKKINAQIAEAYERDDLEAAVPLYKKSIALIKRTGDKIALKTAMQNFATLQQRIKERKQENTASNSQVASPVATTRHTSGNSSDSSGFASLDYTPGNRAVGNIAPYRKALLLAISRNYHAKSTANFPVIQLSIASDGTLLDCKIVESSGDTSIDAMAKRAVETTEFDPLPNWYKGDHLTFKVDIAKLQGLQ